MNEKEILFQVLHIINYQGEKITFVNKFFSLIYLQAITETSSELNPELQEKFVEELSSAKDEEMKKIITLNYLSKEKFDQTLTSITQAQFTDYLETILPTLSLEKQKELTTFLSTLPKPQ